MWITTLSNLAGEFPLLFAARGGGGGAGGASGGTGGGAGGGSGGEAGGAGGVAGGGAGGGAAGGGADGAKPISLSDDALIQIAGMDKPVKFKDWRSGFVAKEDHDALSQQMTTQRKQITEALGRYIASLQAGGGRSAAPEASKPSAIDKMLANLENEPFLTGAQAKQTLSEIVQQLGETPGKLEKYLGQLWKHNQDLGKRLQAIERGRNEESLRSQVRTWLKDNDFDPEYYEDLALDIFEAYEGTPEQVFKVVKQRIDKIEAGKEARMKKKLPPEGAPKLPGRGGDAIVAAKAKSLADKSPEMVADELFELFRTDERV